MLNLDQYTCLGAALREALDRWPNETCLIESDRDKEKTRLTYSDFKEMAMPLARAFEDSDFNAGDRAAIGYEKPHPNAYRCALEVAGNPKSRWMVGDSFEKGLASLGKLAMSKPPPH